MAFFKKLMKEMGYGKLITWGLIIVPVIVIGIVCLILDLVYGPYMYWNGREIVTLLRTDLFQTFVLGGLPVYSFPLGGIVANGVINKLNSKNKREEKEVYSGDTEILDQ